MVSNVARCADVSGPASAKPIQKQLGGACRHHSLDTSEEQVPFDGALRDIRADAVRVGIEDADPSIVQVSANPSVTVGPMALAASVSAAKSARPRMRHSLPQPRETGYASVVAGRSMKRMAHPQANPMQNCRAHHADSRRRG